MNKNLEIEFCKDYMEYFISFAEISDPGIVHDFATHFNWKFEDWKKNGVTISMGGGQHDPL